MNQMEAFMKNSFKLVQNPQYVYKQRSSPNYQINL
jgi:hypothetical protein